MVLTNLPSGEFVVVCIHQTKVLARARKVGLFRFLWKHKDISPDSKISWPSGVYWQSFHMEVHDLHHTYSIPYLLKTFHCQGINSSVIDILLPSYSNLSTTSVNSYHPRQNGDIIVDDRFNCNFVDENLLVSINFYWSLFVGVWLMKTHHF